MQRRGRQKGLERWTWVELGQDAGKRGVGPAAIYQGITSPLPAASDPGWEFVGPVWQGRILVLRVEEDYKFGRPQLVLGWGGWPWLRSRPVMQFPIGSTAYSIA